MISNSVDRAHLQMLSACAGCRRPIRTPRAVTASGQDRIMMEAQNLGRLQAGQTPLFGGENPELFDSDFSGMTPRPLTAATPNPLAAGATPRAGGHAQRTCACRRRDAVDLPRHRR